MAKYFDDAMLGEVANVTPDVAALAAQANTAANAAGPTTAGALGTVANVSPETAAILAGIVPAANPQTVYNKESLVAQAKALQAKMDTDFAAAQASIDLTNKSIADITTQVNQNVTDLAASEDAVQAALQAIRDFDPTSEVLPENKKQAVTDDPAYLAILSQFKAWGMSNIADDIARIRAMYPDIASADLLTLLRTDSRFNQNYMVRFSGNKALMDAGKPMLTEADYLKTESAYEKVFKMYNLPQFMNKTYYGTLIGNEVDSTEVGTRVSLGYNRLTHADPETLQAWKNFYPMLSTGDIVGVMLDPKNQLPELERKVTAAEVGGAALAQGLEAYAAATTIQSKLYSNIRGGTLGAESLVASGENLTQAKADYEKIAKELPRSEFLSSISPYMAQYGQVEAEQANILGLASAQRKRDELAAAEAARYLGKAGTYGSRSFTTKPSGLI